MKKLIALVMCLFTFFSLAACNGENSGGGFAGVGHSDNKIDGNSQNKAEFSKNQAIKSKEIAAGFVKAISLIDSGETSKMNWPAADFPAGYPVYPDGEIEYSEQFFESDLMIFITGTNKTTYNAYIETLRTDGWTFVDIEDEYEGEYAVKGTWSINISYYEDYGVGIYVSDTGFDVESLYADYEWPENIPGKIPVYTDGKIAYTIGDDEFGVYSIAVKNSSKSELENYINKLAGLGWILEADGDFVLDDENGVWRLTAEYDDEDDTVLIALLYTEKYDFGLTDEELALLENNKDSQSAAEWPENEFTKLIPKPDFELFSTGSNADSFTAVFYNISVPMIKDYAEKVKTAGFTVDSDSAETDTTYTYTASDGQGYTVALKLFSGETLYITVEKK